MTARDASPAGLVVALLGAESTGKSDLARALAAHYETRLRCIWIPELLREWCDAQGRTPRIDEQRAIADGQRRRIEAAAQTHALVIADTTPLMTAVYSDYVFGDRSLYADALAWQRDAVALTLVSGLDLPWLPDGLQRDGPQAREPVDALLRGALAAAGIGYGMVYGDGAPRVQAALTAIDAMLAKAAPHLLAAALPQHRQEDGQPAAGEPGRWPAAWP